MKLESGHSHSQLRQPPPPITLDVAGLVEHLLVLEMASRPQAFRKVEDTVA